MIRLVNLLQDREITKPFSSITLQPKPDESGKQRHTVTAISVARFLFSFKLPDAVLLNSLPDLCPHGGIQFTDTLQASVVM